MSNFFHNKSLFKTFFIVSLIAYVYTYASFNSKILQKASLRTQDIFFKIRNNLKRPPDALKKIVVVTIDNESFNALKTEWPWSRDMFAALIERLDEFSADIISINMAFVGDGENPTQDELLVKAMKKAGNVIIASYFTGDGTYVLPDETVRNAVLDFGFVNKIKDMDYVVRYASPFMLSAGGNTADYSFALKIAAKNLGISAYGMLTTLLPKTPALKVATNNKRQTIDLSHSCLIPINYTAGTNLFKTVPFWKVISGKTKPGDFVDKIVLVGTTAELFHDIYETPVGLMPGTLISANEIIMYISGRLLKDIAKSGRFWAILIVCMFILAITHRFGLMKGLIATATSIAIAFLANLILLFLNFNWDFFNVALVAVCSYIVIYTHRNVSILVDNLMLTKEAAVDEIGLHSERYFYFKLRSEVRTAKEKGEKAAVVIMALDGFDSIKKVYSQERIGKIFYDAANLLNASTRKTDTVSRFKKERFSVILHNVGSKEGAIKYAENIRRIIEIQSFKIDDKNLNITASLGVAMTDSEVCRPRELITGATAALSKCLKSGGNKVEPYIYI